VFIHIDGLCHTSLDGFILIIFFDYPLAINSSNKIRHFLKNSAAGSCKPTGCSDTIPVVDESHDFHLTNSECYVMEVLIIDRVGPSARVYLERKTHG
jgi:hypothetical protein